MSLISILSIFSQLTSQEIDLSDPSDFSDASLHVVGYHGANLRNSCFEILNTSISYIYLRHLFSVRKLQYFSKDTQLWLNDFEGDFLMKRGFSQISAKRYIVA